MDEPNLFNLTQLNSVHLTGSIVSTLSLAVITLILLLLIFYKTYNSTLQRLLLYLTITTVIQKVWVTAGYTTQFEYSGHETFCDMINIVWQWSTTVGYLLTLAMIVYLPYKIYQQFKGDPFPRLSRSKCCHVALECLFIFIVSLFPLTYVLPLAHCNYYTTQYICIVRITEDNCTMVTQKTLALAGVLGFIPIIALLGIFVIAIALSVVFCCLASKYRETRATLCRTLILLGFFVVYTIIVLASIGSFRLLQIYVSELMIAVLLPVTGLPFPLAFLFYLYSFNLFRWRAIKRAAAEWRCLRSCCGRENVPRVGQIQEAATMPSSHRVTAPSVTFFAVPLTGEFTGVTAEDGQTLCGTIYGSVIRADL